MVTDSTTLGRKNSLKNSRDRIRGKQSSDSVQKPALSQDSDRLRIAVMGVELPDFLQPGYLANHTASVYLKHPIGLVGMLIPR